MTIRLPDFKARAAEAHERLGSEGAGRILDEGRKWDLSGFVTNGAVVFPHLGLDVCGPQTAAAVHACLDSGAERVLAIGVLHALTRELDDARAEVASGGDPARHPSWGIQGPGLKGGNDWLGEFSLDGFLFLWREEVLRRGVDAPELLVRYPYLAGGRPADLPGVEELEEAAEGAAIVATADPFHHGIGYGDAPEYALEPEEGGLELARSRIEDGLRLLEACDHAAYNAHCVEAKSDARDVGQLVGHLLGPTECRVLDLVWSDMAEAYGAPRPTWVAGALISVNARKEV